MISSSMSTAEMKEVALRTAIEVVAAQPGIIPNFSEGKDVGHFLTDLADSIFEYVTKKPSQQG